MKNIILKFISVIIIFITIFIVYLSTIGIETNRFNDQIKSKVTESNRNLDLDLKKIKLKLDLFKFKISAKTVGATVFFLKRPLALEYIKIEVSLSSFIKNKINSSSIYVKTNSILIKDLIKFIRATNNKAELFILEKTIQKGHIILDINLNTDDNGKILSDYEIKGLIKDTSINILNWAKFKNINLNFNLKKDEYFFKKIKFQLEKVNFISEKINIKRKKDSFLIDGIVKNNQSSLNKNIFKLLKLNFKNINLENVKFSTDNKFDLEINSKLKIKNFNLNSDINLNHVKYKKPKIIQNYFSEINELILFNNHILNLNYNNDNLSIKGKGEIQLGNNIDQIKYLINKKNKDLNIDAELLVKNIYFKKQDFLKIFFPKINKTINLNNQILNIKYNNKNLSFSGSGRFKINKDFEEINYFVEKKENKLKFNTDLKLKNTNFKIDNINYKKKDGTNMLLRVKGEINDDYNLNINSFIVHEDNNKIKITNLSLNDSNQIKKIDQANFNFLDAENKKNNYVIKKISEYDYIISGSSFNANSLISNLLRTKKKEKKFFENNLNLDLNLNEVYIDEIYFVRGLKGKLQIQNNQVVGADILAFFDNSQNIKFTIRTTDNDEKITTIFSSKAKPLVNRYKFIKGFKDDKDGYLDFYSSKKNGLSTSKLVIDNFKVKEIPALAKLLALASLQGIADLLTGEGIRFTDFEMNFTNEDKLMRIQELYAIGPAISILLEGYLEGDNLISLRGTLVPATTINRSIASIPLLGDLLIGKKVGDGVFGVSFKIKGPPKNLETTVNPIKTLTPRFITRTLEKIKKN